MISAQLYRPATGTVEQISFEQVGPLLSRDDVLLWIDISAPEEEELAALASTFQFHPLAMEDVNNQRQRAKVDRYDDFYFIVLPVIDFCAKTYEVSEGEIDIFIGERYLVTIHRNHAPIMEQVWRRCLAGKLTRPTPVFLFYLVSDAVVDSYFPITDQVGEIIDEIDEQIFAEPTNSILRPIFQLRHGMLQIRKALGPMRDAFNELLREEEDGSILHGTRHTRAYLTDVFDHILRIIDVIDTYRDMLSGSLDAFQSSLSNRLNENMQRLTVAATILATATVVTGFYGMNVGWASTIPPPTAARSSWSSCSWLCSSKSGSSAATAGYNSALVASAHGG